MDRLLSRDLLLWRVYARGYDRIWDGPLQRTVATAVATAAGAGRGARILDVGTGTGLVARELTARGATVLGVDVDPGMLAVAARHGRAAALLRADARALPVPTAAFATVVACNLLHLADDPAAVLAELTRVTSPGGRLVLVEPDPRVTLRRVLRTDLALGRPWPQTVVAAARRLAVGLLAVVLRTGWRTSPAPDAGHLEPAGWQRRSTVDLHGCQRITVLLRAEPQPSPE